MDAATLPKGHILGWVAPSSESQQKAKGAATPPPNKNAKKRANQRAKKAEKAEAVKDSWEDDEDVATPTAVQTDASKTQATKEGTPPSDEADKAGASELTEGEAELTNKLSKLDVK